MDDIGHCGASTAIVVQSTVDQTEVLATGIRAAGRDAIVIKADVSTKAMRSAQPMTSWHVGGRIDILVNTARIVIPPQQKTATSTSGAVPWQ